MLDLTGQRFTGRRFEGLRFTGQGVVVTGAAQGIGLAIVTRFLAEGASVVAFDRNAAALDSVVAGLGPRCVAVTGDVSARPDCERAVEVCAREFGRRRTRSTT